MSGYTLLVHGQVHSEWVMSVYDTLHILSTCGGTYGVATVSRIDKFISLFCGIASLLKVSLAKETYTLIDPTNQSHPIANKASHTYG